VCFRISTLCFSLSGLFIFSLVADCSQFDNMSSCVLASYGKCGWSNATDTCVELSSFAKSDLALHCASGKFICFGNTL